jgi:hypothetical protein
MSRGTHIDVRELSPALQSALKSVRYGAKSVEVIPAETLDIGDAGGSGQRAFAVAVNLDTGERAGTVGSWGGPNPFTSNPVDAGERVAIPENGAIVKGTMGYPRTFAWVYAHPTAMGRMLPSGEPEVTFTEAELWALHCHAHVKGGAYRREELSRRDGAAEAIDGLVSRGYLSRNRAGATAITTAGRNVPNLPRY